MRIREVWKENRIYKVLLLFLLLLLVLCKAARAQESGSIELHFSENVQGIEMTLYPVADYVDGTFVFSEAYSDCGVSLEHLSDAEEAEHIAQQLAVIAEEKGEEGITGAVDENGVMRYTQLQPAYYLLVQTGGQEVLNVQMMLVPVPFTQEDGVLCYEVSLIPKASVPEGAVVLIKTDEEGNAVEQAVFRLEKKEYVSLQGALPEGTESGQDVGGRYFWKLMQEGLATDEDGELSVGPLAPGTYRFVETFAPDGFVLNPAPNYVSVEGTEETLTVMNEHTLVWVNKVDESGEPVSGARLVVKSADGKTIVDEGGCARYSFTSSEEPYELKGLPAGEYFLSEVEPPEGYEVSGDVLFTVDDTYGAVNEVTMVDLPKEETDVMLSVTKTLEDQEGYLIASEDAMFYVALFEDADYTKRVSEVRKIMFRGTSSETVVFDNLEPGKTYYIIETDAYGELLDGIPYIGGLFAPEYPQGNAVTLTPQNPHQEYAFKNVFYELPKDYYYSGEITIRKEVLRDSQPYETDGVFYAGVFTDEACTQRYGSVIELDMDGASEVTVTVPVSIGRLPEGVMTYYIAETDHSGKVLNASEVNFTISIDKTVVTLDVENKTEEVTITNSYEKEEEYESETQPSIAGSGSVQTDDETPVEVMIILMVMAAAVMMVLRKMKRC